MVIDMTEYSLNSYNTITAATEVKMLSFDITIDVFCLILQVMTEDLFWYYIVELGFYVSLTISQFVDVQRKVCKALHCNHFTVRQLDICLCHCCAN